MSNKQSTAGTVGGALGSALKDLCQLLTIVSCALRACDVINWSWFWVLSPIFASWALALVRLVIVDIIAGATLKND